MAPRQRVTKTGNGVSRRPPRLKPGVKREQILEVAAEYFGRSGYEDTKWADVAAAVGIGSTALYHYFESKQHCLFEICGQALTDFQERFERNVRVSDDWETSLVAVLTDLFELTDKDVLRLRVLVAEQGLVGIPRTLPREEEARAAAATRMRDLEFVWGTFLARGMQQGALPESDPKLLCRAVLGLYNSIWHWYRPGGSLDLAAAGRFFVPRMLATLGCSPDLAATHAPAAP